MINTQDVVDNVKWELGSFFSTEAHQNNAIIRYINSAVRYICTRKNFTFNKFNLEIVVIDGVTEYTIPDQIETFSFLDGASDPMTVRNFERYYTTKDRSAIVWIWDDKLLCTTPWTYNLLYRWYPALITSLSGTINVPERFFDAIVGMALYYGYMDEKDYATANARKTPVDWLIGDLATRNSNVYPEDTVRVWSNHNF